MFRSKSHGMDDNEQIHRPSKRARSEIKTLGSLTSEHDHYQCYNNSVYPQAPPRLNLEEARNISPSTSTCELTHPLTAGYSSVQYTEWLHQKTTQSAGFSSSILPSAAETPFKCNDRLSVTEAQSQVCFGMVGLSFKEKSL